MSADNRVGQALAAAFAGQRAVFWHDIDSEFSASVQALSQGSGVRLIRLDEQPALRTKIDIEADLKAGDDSRWLLYSNLPEPIPTDDWLLDLRLRSKSFRADATSILLEDLGLESLALAPHLKLRQRFLRAKDRIDRLKRLLGACRAWGTSAANRPQRSISHRLFAP